MACTIKCYLIYINLLDLTCRRGSHLYWSDSEVGSLWSVSYLVFLIFLNLTVYFSLSWSLCPGCMRFDGLPFLCIIVAPFDCRRERDNSEAERAQHVKQIHDFQEHIQEKERQLMELQEQVFQLLYLIA